MTPQPLPFDAPQTRKRKPSLTDRMASFFRAYDGEWHDVDTLARVAGIGGWRTRVSEARHRGMHIEQRLIRWPDGRNRSQYRLVQP